MDFLEMDEDSGLPDIKVKVTPRMHAFELATGPLNCRTYVLRITACPEISVVAIAEYLAKQKQSVGGIRSHADTMKVFSFREPADPLNVKEFNEHPLNDERFCKLATSKIEDFKKVPQHQVTPK